MAGYISLQGRIENKHVLIIGTGCISDSIINGEFSYNKSGDVESGEELEKRVGKFVVYSLWFIVL